MPDAFVPESPLSMIIEPEDALVLEEADVLVELDEVVVLVGTNLTASAQVVLLLDWETITTFACPEKLYVPSKFHLPPFCN